MSRSLGKNSLTVEDREYLAWLEMSAEEKMEAIKSGASEARWALGVVTR